MTADRAQPERFVFEKYFHPDELEKIEGCSPDGAGSKIGEVLTDSPQLGGDADLDLAVSQDDLTLVLGSFGQVVDPADPVSGDTDADGVVTSGDVAVVVASYGAESALAPFFEPGDGGAKSAAAMLSGRCPPGDDACCPGLDPASPGFDEDCFPGPIGPPLDFPELPEEGPGGGGCDPAEDDDGDGIANVCDEDSDCYDPAECGDGLDGPDDGDDGDDEEEEEEAPEGACDGEVLGPEIVPPNGTAMYTVVNDQGQPLVALWAIVDAYGPVSLTSPAPGHLGTTATVSVGAPYTPFTVIAQPVHNGAILCEKQLMCRVACTTSVVGAASLAAGESTTLEASTNLLEPEYEWTVVSGGEAIELTTVGSTAVVTAAAPGEATVRVRATQVFPEDPGDCMAWHTIVVEGDDGGEPGEPACSVSIEGAPAAVHWEVVGDHPPGGAFDPVTMTLTAQTTPAGGTVAWSVTGGQIQPMGADGATAVLTLENPGLVSVEATYTHGGPSPCIASDVATFSFARLAVEKPDAHHLAIRGKVLPLRAVAAQAPGASFSWTVIDPAGAGRFLNLAGR